MEVDTDQAPAEGQVLIFTMGGAFLVNGSVREVIAKLNADEWTDLVLAESGDHVVLRSSQVVALRPGTKHRRGTIGFVPRSSG